MLQVKENPTRNIPPSWLEIFKLILFGLAYWLSIRIGLLLVVQPEGIASIWLASGVALAALLLSPKKRWVALLTMIFTINLIGNWANSNSLPVSLGFALIGVLEAVLCAWALISLRPGAITFADTRDIFALLGMIVTVNSITALLSATIVTLAYASPFISAWQIWWVSNGLGILLITPLIVTWARNPHLRWPKPFGKILEGFLLIVLLTAFAFVAFGSTTMAEHPILDEYMLLPLLVWLTFRFNNPRNTSSAILLVAAIALWGTQHRYGLFAHKSQSITEEMAFLQIYILVMTFSGLLLNAVIAERTHDNETLKIADANYRNILEHTPIGFFQSYPNGGYRNINPRMAQIFGYESSTEMLQAITDIPHQIYAEPAMRQEFARQLLETGRAVNFVTQHLRKDGSSFWAATNARIVHDEHGQPFYYEGFIQDIDEAVKTEQNIQESRKFVQATMDSLSAHICVLEADGTILAVNQAWMNFAGQNPPVTANGNVGINYLKVCDATTGAEAQMAHAFAAGIRSVIAGAQETFYLEYPCHAPHEQRWFIGRVMRFADPASQRVVIAHENITERKLAQDALLASETSLKLSQRVAHVGHWTWDTVSNRVAGSDEMYRIFGLNPASFDGGLEDIITQSVHPEDREKVIQSTSSVLTEQKSVPLEYRIILPDQSIRMVWAEAGESIYADDGKIIQLSGIVQDITERKMAENALRASEQFLKAITDHLPGMVGYWTNDLHCGFANKEYVNWFGRTPEQMQGIAMQELFGEELFKENEPHVLVALRGEAQQFERMLIKPNGEAGHLFAQYIPHWEDGKVMGFFVLTIDITQLKRDQERLRISEEKWRTLFSILPVGITILDAERRVTDFNPALAEIFDISADGLRSGAYRSRKYLRADGSPMSAAEYPPLRALQEQIIIQSAQVGIVKEDNSIIWTEISAAPLALPNAACVVVTTDVTRRKQAELALRESERNIRIFFETMTEGMALNEMILNENGEMVDYRILDTNPVFYQTADFNNIPVIGSLATQLYGMSHEAIHAFWRAHKDKDTTVYTEMRSPISKKWFYIATSPFVDGKFVTSFLDITLQKNRQEELAQINQRLSLAQSAAGAGLWDWDMREDFYNWSPELFELFGLSQTITPTGEIWRSGIHPEDCQRADEHIQTALREHLPIDNEYRIVRPSGEVRWVNALGNTTYDAQGQPLRMAGICIDITARKQAEHARLESEARLQGIVSSAMDGIVMVDSDQRITLFNPAAERMFGYTANKVIGQPLDVVLPRGTQEIHHQHIERFGETGISTRNITDLIDITAERATGETFPLEQSVSQFTVNGQKFYTAILRDVTERKLMEQNLRTSLQEKEVLLKEVHHRVKNNLQIVSSLLSMQASSAKDEKVTHALEESKNRVRAMALIHEKLYRSESLEYIQAEEYIPELINNLSNSMAGFKKERVRFDIQITTATLDIGKAIPCGMIVTELISNALKYAFTHEEQGVVQVHLEKELDTGRIRLLISDNGVGLPPELDLAHPETLGLELVSILSRQLKAELQIIRQPGTTYILSFKN